jgi:hypothetical protein
MPSTTVVRASTRRVRLAVVLTGLVALMVTMVRPLRTPHRVPAVAAPPAEEPAPEDPAEKNPPRKTQARTSQASSNGC